MMLSHVLAGRRCPGQPWRGDCRQEVPRLATGAGRLRWEVTRTAPRGQDTRGCSDHAGGR